MAIQIFVRLIDGHTRCLSFPSSPSISGETLKRRLSDLTGIPASSQRLVSGTLDIRDETLVPPPDASGFPPTLHLLLRLPGGKGGFGSLLRGAATKAGQKKTNNFDACRDMSGRRLRHVNAEKRLEEWRAEAEERKLERIAEEFLKRKAKEVRKGAAKGPTEKYVEKYREESERCAGEVEEAVRESFRLYEEQKRKALPTSGSASKRLKLWFGKQKLEESGSEEEDEDDEDNDRKSVVTDGEGTSGSGPEGPNSWPKEQVLNERENNKDNDSDEGNGKSVLNDSGKSVVQSNERDGSLGLVSECNLGGDSSGEGSSQSNLDDECGSLKDSVNGAVDTEVDGSIGVELSVHSETVVELNVHVSDPVQSLDPADNGAPGSHSSAPEPKTCLEVTEGASVPDVEKPLNFNDYNSATEMEVLGMERLKMELQTRGLKCGGTLHERAERLFLLKTTPIHMLPKKILAKPRS